MRAARAVGGDPHLRAGCARALGALARPAQRVRPTRHGSTRLRVAARIATAWDCAERAASVRPRSTLTFPRFPQVRGSDGDLPFLSPAQSSGMAKRKRPPNLDISAICSWQPRGGAPEPPLGPCLREGSPRRNSCPLQSVTASPIAAPERLFKRARRPGLQVRCWRRVDCSSCLTVVRATLRPCSRPQRCRSVPDFGSALADEEAEALALRDDCAASIISPRPSLDMPSRFSQADRLADQLAAQLGSSSLRSPSNRGSSSPDSVAAHG